MPFRYNALTSKFDLVDEAPSGASDVFHIDPLTAGKIVIGAGTDFITVSGIDVDGSDNVSNINTISVLDILGTQQNLNLEPGVDIQAWSAILDQLALLSPTEGDMIFSNGTPEWDILSIGAEGEVLRVVSGVPDWTADTSGFTWNEVVGTSQALSVGNGYIGNNAGTITMTLPATADVGQKICFIQKGAGVIRVAQNASQTIHTISSDTTTGVTGYLETIDQWSSFCLVCVTTNNDWALESGSHGSLTTN